MFTKRKKSSGLLKGLFIGASAATIITLLTAPKSGKDLRSDIKKQANDYLKKAKDYGDKIVKDSKKSADDLTAKANDLLELVKKYASGNYTGPIDKIEREIRSLKAAINAAVESYMHKTNGETTEKTLSKIFTEGNDPTYSEYDDEVLPKQESMRRRDV